MKKITNRLLCALILLCAFGVFVGCQQETSEPTSEPTTTENPMKNWVVGSWREALAGMYGYVYKDYGYEIVIKSDGTWINNSFYGYEGKVHFVEKGTWLFNSNEDIIVRFVRDDGCVTFGSFTSDSNADLLMINDKVYKRYQ